MDITIVVPVKNEAKNVSLLAKNVISVMKNIKKSWEIIFIDDGSTDSTLHELRMIKSGSLHIRVISLQANFGKAAALSVGFSRAKGDYIITMDGDLQDDASEIPRFLQEIKRFDLVSGWKQKRQDSLAKTLPSKLFNYLARKMTHVNIHDFNCGFKIYRRNVVENIDLYGEMHRYIPAIAHWKGYSVGEMKVKHQKRIHGESKYGWSRLFKGFFDLLTVRFLLGFSRRPMHFFGILGFLSFLLGSFIGAYLVYLRAIHVKIGDRPLLMLSVLLIVIGVQFVSLGLLGEMMVQNRKDSNYPIREEF